MHQKKTSPLKVLGAVIVNAVLLPAVLFLLISCGGTAPSNQQAVSHPAAPLPPSLFVLSSHGDVNAFRADGTSLWQAPADTNSDSMPSANGTHLLDTGKMVYLATDFLRAYSRTGQLRWQHDLPYRTDDSLLVGSTLYIVGGGIATAWNTLKGTLQWQQSPVAGTALTSDTHDLLVSGGNQVTAFNLQSGAKAWNVQGDPGEIIKTLTLEGNILLIRTDGSLTAVQAATGKLIWHRESQIQTLSINAAANIIYTVYIDVPLDTSPITSGLRAFSLDTGKQLWNVPFPIKDGENGSISTTGIVWASQTMITAWDLNGKQRWQIPYVGKPITQVMSIDTGSFFVLLDQDGTMIALDTLNGHQHWQVTLGAGNGFQIIIKPALIWIINQDTGSIQAFDLNGKRQWSLNSVSGVNEVVIE